MTARAVVPHGESLRRAVRWLAGQRRHDRATLAEAGRRFDLDPLEQEFLYRHFGASEREGQI